MYIYKIFSGPFPFTASYIKPDTKLQFSLALLFGPTSPQRDDYFAPMGGKRSIADVLMSPNKRKRSRIVRMQPTPTRGDDDDGMLPRVLSATIYLYAHNDGTPVYVGQTVRDLIERDKEHLRSTKGEFDSTYTSKSQYSLTVLASKTFQASDFADECHRMMEDCQKWIDEAEIRYIAQHDTYNKGLNKTRVVGIYHRDIL